MQVGYEKIIFIGQPVSKMTYFFNCTFLCFLTSDTSAFFLAFIVDENIPGDGGQFPYHFFFVFQETVFKCGKDYKIDGTEGKENGESGGQDDAKKEFTPLFFMYFLIHRVYIECEEADVCSWSG